jgi:hypothetical protein
MVSTVADSESIALGPLNGRPCGDVRDTLKLTRDWLDTDL